MKTFSFVAALILVWFAYQRLYPVIVYPPGVLVASEPVQTEASADEVPVAYGKFQLKALARFSLDARVLHQKIYRYDRGADLVPVDLAVGWGPMSDQAVLDRLTISQASRFFYYEYKGVPPIPREEIVSHATNLHLIPSDKAIATQCRSLRSGDLVHLAGLLVEASGPGIGTWRSSLSRTDTGNGACELVWVEEVEQLHR